MKLFNNPTRVSNAPRVKTAKIEFVMPEPKYLEQGLAIRVVDLIGSLADGTLRSLLNEFGIGALLIMKRYAKRFGTPAVAVYTSNDDGVTKLLNLAKVIIYQYVGDPTPEDVEEVSARLKQEGEDEEWIKAHVFEIADKEKRELRNSIHTELVKFAKEILADGDSLSNGLSGNNPTADMDGTGPAHAG